MRLAADINERAAKMPQRSERPILKLEDRVYPLQRRIR